MSVLRSNAVRWTKVGGESRFDIDAATLEPSPAHVNERAASMTSGVNTDARGVSHHVDLA